MSRKIQAVVDPLLKKVTVRGVRSCPSLCCPQLDCPAIDQGVREWPRRQAMICVLDWQNSIVLGFLVFWKVALAWKLSVMSQLPPHLVSDVVAQSLSPSLVGQNL
jgi:hypothetical protein